MATTATIPGVGQPPSWWPEDFDSWPLARQEELLTAMHASTPKIRLRFTPYTPTPKQFAFLMTGELEAFYGGAAGPGKSTALLMAALQFADVPGYAALLLRKSYQELSLPGALMPMADEWLAGTGARYVSQTHTWHLPGGGTLTFGYLDNPKDKYRYKSSEFQFIGFDELTEFDEDNYEYLFSRLRRSRSSIPAPDGVTLDDIPLRMRSASNPGGPGHDWVQQRFVDDATREPGAVYIPALLQENPHLNRAEYEANLERLHGAEKARLLRGDWGAIDQGDVFNTSLIWQVDDWAAMVGGVRYWDLAATEPHEGNKDPDYTTGTKMELGEDGYVTITDVKHVRLGPGAVERFVQEVAIMDGFHIPVFIEQDPGQAGKAQVHNYARMMPGVMVRPGLTKNMDKRTRSTPAAGAFENRVLRINKNLPNLQTVLLELRRFPNEGTHDDIVDTISGGYTSLTQSGIQSVTSVSSAAEGQTSATGVSGPADMPRSPASVAEMMRRRQGGTR